MASLFTWARLLAAFAFVVAATASSAPAQTLEPSYLPLVEIRGKSDFEICKVTGAELECHTEHRPEVKEGVYRLTVASQVLRVWNVIQTDNKTYIRKCWKVVPPTDETTIVDLDGNDGLTYCPEWGDENGWADPANPLVKINWVPQSLPRNTPILVSDPYEEERAVFLSYGQLIDGKMAWTVNVSDLEKRFYAVPRPVDTIKSAGEDLDAGIAAALDQSRLADQILQLQHSLAQTAEGGVESEQRWKQALNHVTWPMHWAWVFYVMSPDPIRQTLREQAASILVLMAQRFAVSNEIVGQYLTNLTWDQVAATDPTLLEIDEFRFEETDELFQKRTGMSRDDAYARLWWRRRGKHVFETFRTEFLKVYPSK